MRLERIDLYAPTWRATLDELYATLGGADNPTLFPYHFLQAAFPTIGGKLFRLIVDDEAVAVIFLLPHLAAVEERDTALSAQEPTIAYIARLHYLTADRRPLTASLQALLREALDNPNITLYDPQATHTYAATTQSVGALEVGRPGYAEAETIRLLQQQIWGSPKENLYPIDIHSEAFPLGTTLVARVDERVAGFLFGFYKLNGPALPLDWQHRWHGELRIESQVMGVLPEHRGLRIGYLLKRIQAEEALAAGIGIIHWTVDPLQYPNAALNFGLLRAVAFTFTPDYYAFRNELNRGPASRFSLTWLIGSTRVKAQPLHDARSSILAMAQHPEIIRVNRGWQEIDLSASAPMMAIEIPMDWTGMQRENPTEALAWRAATDRLFTHYIGSAPGKYVVTDVGVDEDRRYLIIQQVTDDLWRRLGEA